MGFPRYKYNAETPECSWTQLDNVWPKTFDTAPAIEPQQVLDAIEVTLEKDTLWVFPGRGTKLGWRVRLWFPRLMWKIVHRTEGF